MSLSAWRTAGSGGVGIGTLDDDCSPSGDGAMVATGAADTLAGVTASVGARVNGDGREDGPQPTLASINNAPSPATTASSLQRGPIIRATARACSWPSAWLFQPSYVLLLPKPTGVDLGLRGSPYLSSKLNSMAATQNPTLSPTQIKMPQSEPNWGWADSHLVFPGL